MPISQVPFAGISNPVDFRNIVINGDMQIAQRSTSVASITTGGYYTVDRFIFEVGTIGTWTMSQSTDVPTGEGFASSIKLDCTTADATPSAADFLLLSQYFEGQNLQYLKKGTANALPLTLSFWVKSTKTGTFIAEIRDIDNNRSISKSYTVSVTNTWEFKTITFPGDTTGTLDNNNEKSLELNLWLGAGTTYTSGTLQTSWGTRVNANRAAGVVNLADSTSNDFLITGVQLEAGEQASGFEFMPIDVNLVRCERYYQNSFNTGNIPGTSTSALDAVFVAAFNDGNSSMPRFNTIMRASPTVTLRANSSTTTGQVNSFGTNRSATASQISTKGVSFITITSGTANAYVGFTYEASAEL